MPSPISWSDVARSCRDRSGRIDQQQFSAEMLQMSADDYRRSSPSAELVEHRHGPALYLFDAAGSERAERTVAVVARPERPAADRDVSYQRGYPLPDKIAGRSVDRGHLVAFSAGGLFGPNLIVQDRALNRGWSTEGKAYRSLERAAVAAPGSLMIVRCHYCDDTATPEFVELGVVDGSELRVQCFRNRYDTVDRDSPDLLSIYLAGAADTQIGALGEETAAVFVEETLGGTVVAMGDAALPRPNGQQELDLLAIVDETLVVFEVKSRYMSRIAGRRTRGGNLSRPRLRRASQAGGNRQGSQDYVTARISPYVNVDDEYEGVDVRVLVVDLKAMLAQQFVANDAGTRVTPLGPPMPCHEAARQALEQILDHRSFL